MSHKKQHWIPQSYLSAWTDPDTPTNQEPYVWMFVKDGSTAKHKAPRNIFWENELYTIHRGDGERDLTLEHGLMGLEDSFAKIRRERLVKRIDPSPEERAYILLFIAAMQVRTVSQRDHMKNQWGEALKMMDSLAEQVSGMTKEEKKKFAAMQPMTSSGSGKSLSHEQVRNLAQKPLQHTMFPMIISQTKIFSQMHMAIIGTTVEPGFITSDSPCVWFDPEAYKRPPFYRAVGLGYETVEITLPVSPKQAILLSWNEKYEGYMELNYEKIIEELNRQTRFQCDEYFVVNKNVKKDIWFDPGVEPEDSWEKMQQKQKDETKNS